MKQIGTQIQRDAAMEASKLTGSTEIVPDSPRPKKPRPLSKQLPDQSCVQTLVNLQSSIFKYGDSSEPRSI